MSSKRCGRHRSNGRHTSRDIEGRSCTASSSPDGSAWDETLGMAPWNAQVLFTAQRHTRTYGRSDRDGQLPTTKLRRKARHLHLESFDFAHDGVFLELQPEPHLDEGEASEREG